MKSKFKRAVAFAASLAMCGMTLLHFPSGTFDIGLPVLAAEGDAETDCTGEFDANGFCTEHGTHYEPATDTDGNNVYEIANGGQLYWFMEQVNTSGEKYVDIDAVLTADIIVNENVLKDDGTPAEGDFREWFPIGNSSVYYNGTFDGQKHTISGLYFKNTEQFYVGLFGWTDSGAEIRNVTVADSYFNAKYYVGGVCGYNDGTITNSTNSGSVNGSYSVGGVCGYNSYGTITNSTNSGSVNGSNYVGGVCGYNSYGTITNSTNSGSVNGSNYVGGVCGYNYEGTITNSTNSDSVTGKYYVGGVCGYNDGTITNSTNSGSVEDNSNFVGGVCGWNYNGTITNCYYDSTVFTGDAVGLEAGTTTNAFGKTTAEFKSGEVAYLLSQGCTVDGTFYSGDIWGQEIGVQDYPVLDGMTVYYHYTDCYRKQKNYTNNAKEATGHDFVNGTCVHCGNTPSCVHPVYENGFCLACDSYEPATDTNEDGVYEIANAGQLYWFMEQVNNSGEESVDIDAVLTADITINEGVLNEDGTLAKGNFRAWFPIGYYHDRDGVDGMEDIYYNGTFDGQEHTISGLYFDNAEQNYVGLFGQIYSGAEICNVTVADSYFNASNNVGGVCGYNDGTITNSTNSGSVEGANDVGGVCGYNYSGTITNSTNSGSVNGSYNVGGVCGCNDQGTVTNSTNSGSVTGSSYYVGGVCGYNNNGTITNSTNIGSVEGEYYVGGVCGYNYSGTITNSTNIGSVEGLSNYVGGVCGVNAGAITNSTNSGSVEGNGWFGGVCGINKGTITNSTNSGSVNGSDGVGGVCGWNEGTITNSTNSGSVTGPSNYVGGVCGRNYNGTITNCYYDSTVFTGNAVGSDDGTTTNALGKTTAEFKSGEVAYLLQSAQTETDEDGNPLHVWGQTLGEDTYPVLGGDKVYDCTSECSGTFYSNTEGDTKAHAFDANGFCTNADCKVPYEPATDIDEDSVYEIANGGQLYWFMEQVNTSGEKYVDIDAVLTADIIVNENVLKDDGTPAEGDFRAWFPIGYYYDRDENRAEEEVVYKGTFDGQGYTISGLYFDNAEQDYVGLFGQTHSGAEIRNVTVADSYFKGSYYVGGVCGYNYEGTFTNSTNSGSVDGSDYVGGVCGRNDYGTITNSTNSGSVEGTDSVGGVCGRNDYGIITNSTNSGSVTGKDYVGGVCGYNYYGTLTNSTNSGSVEGTSFVGGVCGYNSTGIITNSTNSGSVNGSYYVGGVCGLNSGTITNCYYDSTVFTGNAVGPGYDVTNSTPGKTTAEFQSGEVAYLLQSAQTETDDDGKPLHVWGQTLGEDTYPVLDGDKVYECKTECGGTFYSNTENDTQAHLYDENGFCTNADCKAPYEPATDIDEDNVYEIANGGQLYWFMEHVNKGNTETDAILTADITVNEDVLNEDGTLADGDFRAWFPIGNDSVRYKGSFDGQEHTISGLYFNNPEQDYVGLFGQTYSGAEIRNVTVADSYFKGRESVGGVCGYNNYGTITNSTNSGSVNGANYVGGVFGFNAGTVTNSTNSGSVNGSNGVSGVCGENWGTITNSTNSGSVTGDSRVGGVCGENLGTITNSTNSGSVKGTYYVGGVCGENYGTITNCYYDSTVFTGNAVGANSGTTANAFGKTTAEFKSGEVAYLLSQGCTVDGTFYSGDIWGQTPGTDTHPVLGGDKVYECKTGCGVTFYSNTEGDTQAHLYDDNGFCTNAACKNPYQPATDTNEDGVYEIANGGQLYWFMEHVNEGNTETDAILTADITVNEGVLNEDGEPNDNGSNFRAWFPIGNNSVPYNGNFDGKEHTISGLYFYNAEQDNVGLFGLTDSGAEICNVTVADSYFNANEFVGGVCGWNYDGTIINSANSSSVTGSSYYVGGVCGYNYSGTITNSTNSGSVNGANYVGGVCGCNDQGTVTNSTNSGSVTGSSYFVGGVCGYNSGTITSSTNSGSVTGLSENVSGVCGYNSSSGTITNSTNSGSVKGTYYVGGVCGENYGTITNCYYDSDVFDGNAVESDSGTTTDVLDKTTAEFQSGEVAYLLRQGCTVDETFYSGDIWGQTIGEETYPVLGGDKVIKCGTEYVNNAHLDQCKCTPIDPELNKADGFVDTYTYGDTIDITAEDFTTISDPEQIEITWQDVEGDEAPVNAGNYKLSVTIPETYYNDILYAEDTLTIDITIERAALEASDFTFTAPENLTYDGSEKTALLESELDGIGEMTLTYYDENSVPLVGAPVNAGTYTVKVNVAEGTNYQAAEELTDENWTFTIGTAELTKADLIVMGSQYQVYDKNGNLFTVLLDDSLIGTGELTVTYADTNGAVDGINGAGTYTVTATVTEGTNYNAASFDWTVTIYKSVIRSVTVDVTAPEAAEVPQSIVETGEGYTASIEWIPAADAFDYNAAYTAVVTLTPDANHQFTDKSEITAEGFTITRNEDGTITLTRAYDVTAKAKITDLTAPKDVLLEEHQPDADAVIALLPTTVQIESENGTTELPIKWTFVGDYDIAANAEHTFTWTADCGDLDVNGFEMTGTITVTNPDYTDISDQITLTAKDITYGEEPVVSAVYDENDAEITYSKDGVTFDELDTFLNEDGVLPAGTYTVKAYYESETEMGSVTVEFTVNQATPSYEIPTNLTATYGDTLADVELPEGYTWADNTQSVGNAGTNTFKVTFTPADTDNYEVIEGIEVEIEVAKAKPSYEIPADLTATYGDTLADVELPEGFTWQDDLTTSVGNAGTNTFKVTFTPADTNNYEIVKDIEVEVEVAKAVPEVTPIIPEGEYTEGDALPELLYRSETDGLIAWMTELKQLIVGENVLEWQFTPDDQKNYEAVTGTAIVEAKATTTTTTTTTTETTTTTTTSTTTTESTTTSTTTATTESATKATTTEFGTIATTTTTSETTTKATTTESGTTVTTTAASETTTKATTTESGTTTTTTATSETTTKATTTESGTTVTTTATSESTTKATTTESGTTTTTTATSETTTKATTTESGTTVTTTATSESTTKATTTESGTSATTTATSETTTKATTTESGTTATTTATTESTTKATTTESGTSATTTATSETTTKATTTESGTTVTTTATTESITKATTTESATTSTTKATTTESGTTTTTTATSETTTKATTTESGTTATTTATTESTTKATTTESGTSVTTTATTKATTTESSTIATTTVTTESATKATTTESTMTTTTTTESATTSTTTTETTTTSASTTETTTTSATTTESTTTTTTTTESATTFTTKATTTTESTTTSTTKTTTTTTESATTSTTKATTTTESTTTSTTKATTTTESTTTTTTESTTTTTTTTESATTSTSTTESTTTTTTTTETTTTTTTTTESATTSTTTTESTTTTTTTTESATTSTTESTATTTTTTESAATSTTTTETTTTSTTTTESTTTTTTTTESTTTTETTTTTTITGYTYVVETKAPNFYFSHDTSEFQPEDLIESITRYAVYSDGTTSENGEVLDDFDAFDFGGLTPEILYTQDGNEYYVSLNVTDEFGTHTITEKVKAYIGVKGDANLDGTADAKDAAKLLEYAAAIGAGQDAPLYSDSDEMSENLAYFLAEVNSSGDADAKDAALILEYAAAIGSGEPKTWDEILGAA